METLSYNSIFRPEPEGGYTVIVPALPGCITYGKDLHEARTMAADAIAGYITSLEKHGESIPTDKESFIASIQFERSERTHTPYHAKTS